MTEESGASLELENKELKARVMELRAFIIDVVDWRSPCGPAATELLSRTPAQSLEAHDRSVAKRYFGIGFSIGYGGADIDKTSEHFERVWERLNEST